MSSKDDCSSNRVNQRSVRRKKRPRAFMFTQKVSSENNWKEACSTYAMFIILHGVFSKLPSTDRACSSDSLCEMKGLRLIDMEELLASVTRRASCNVCGSGLG